jgi:autotransporter-associated beta strand protein
VTPLTATPTTVLNISGGTFNVIGNSSSATTETLSQLTVGSGAGMITLNANAARSITITVATLNALSNAGTLLLRGNLSAPGTAAANGFANIVATTFSVPPNQTAGTGTNGAITKPIRPDILGQNVGPVTVTSSFDDSELVVVSGVPATLVVGSQLLGQTVLGISGNNITLAGNADQTIGSSTVVTYEGPLAFLTKDTATGFLRPLATNEIGTTLVNQTQANVALSTNAQITFSQTVGSLVLKSGGGITSGMLPAFGRFNSSGGILYEVINTGGVMAFNGNAGISTPGLFSNSGPLYFHTMGDSTVLNVSSHLCNGGGLVKAGNGTLRINARGYYSGTTTVNAGTLILNGGNNTIWAPLNLNSAINGQGALTTTTASFQALTVNAGTLDLNGFNQAVAFLNSNNALPVGGTVTNSSGTAVTLTTAGNTTVFGGSLTGNLGYTNHSAMTLTNANSYTGATLVRANTLTLRDTGTLSGTSSVAVNFAALNWDNSGLNTLGNLDPTRIGAAVPLTLQGGILTITGGGSFDTNAAFNNVTLQRGGSTINVLPAVNAGSAVSLSIGDLARSATDHGVLNFVSNVGMGGSGNNNNARVSIASINGAGFSAAQMVNNLVGGWAVVNGNSFATYKDGVGLGELGTTVGGNAFAGGNVFRAYDGGDLSAANTQATWNINDTSNRTLTLSKGVNSLRMANGGAAQTITLGNGTTAVTLTLGVGLLTNTGQATNITSGNAASALTSSGAELFAFINQGTTTFNTKVTGAMSLVKGGGGALTLNPGAGVSNDYTGGTYINGGTLNLAGSASTIVIPGDLVINNATVTMANANMFNATTGQIAAASNVSLNGGSVLNLFSYTGTTTTTLASLTFNNTGGTTQPRVMFNNPTALSTLVLSAANAITAVNDNFGTTPVIQGATNPALSALQLSNAAPVINVSGLSPIGLIISAPITSAGGAISKSGNGSLALTGASTFTNGFNLNEGTLIFGRNTTGSPGALTSGAIGTGTLAIANGTTIQAGNFTNIVTGTTQNSAAVSIASGTAQLTVGQAVFGSGIALGAYIVSIDGANAFTMSVNNTAPTNAANTLSFSTFAGNAVTVNGDFGFGGPALNQSLTLTGAVNLGSAMRTITVADPSFTQNIGVTAMISGAISGTGAAGITKNGNGTLVLTNNTNSWTGATIINGGVLRLGATSNNAAGAGLGNVLPSGTAVTIAQGAALDLAGRNQTIGSLAGAGFLTNSNGGVTSTLTVGGNNSSTVFSGILTAASVSRLNLVKEGSGTLTLSGANNYTGTTTINGGVISVSSLGNGGIAGGIGAATNAAANLIINGGTLRYTGISPRYTTGTGTFGNGDLSLSLGAVGVTTAGPFATGTLNTPRTWAGTLYYDSHNINGSAGYGFFGDGCAGTLGKTSMPASSQPTLGGTLTVGLDNLPFGIAVMVLGTSNTVGPLGPLPLDLGILGAPGCPLRVSVDVTDTVVGAGNAATWSFAVPNSGALAGFKLYNQAAVLDTSNAFGFVTSKAYAWIVGS